ncbi:MAG TPA: hypothetical protein PLL33_14310, partial [Paracoccus sp. (in: a-proteobacteria)]|nr:hypothetical protein [Paracoccus sp. (in: a-proteobacteria)]
MAGRRALWAGALAAALWLAGGPVAVHAETALPDRRVVLQDGFDLPGNDRAALFDTTRQACLQACIADAGC